MSFHEPEYLGDAVYVVRDDAGDLLISLGDHRNYPVVVLEQEVYEKLIAYAERTMNERHQEMERLQKQ